MASETEFIQLPMGVLIPVGELEFEFSRAGGPGGQNVNKVNSRVTLRFDVRNSPSLPERARGLLRQGLSSRLTSVGLLVMHCSKHREQRRNRREVIERFESLLREILTPRKKRRPTRPTRGSVERRLKEQKQRGQIKQWRRKPGSEE
ncbi:MAG: alternative ribosome rescue aminoacyl-tRNA hydrolase ArfB [Planctomycetota bacterium]